MLDKREVRWRSKLCRNVSKRNMSEKNVYGRKDGDFVVRSCLRTYGNGHLIKNYLSANAKSVMAREMACLFVSSNQ